MEDERSVATAVTWVYTLQVQKKPCFRGGSLESKESQVMSLLFKLLDRNVFLGQAATIVVHVFNAICFSLLAGTDPFYREYLERPTYMLKSKRERLIDEICENVQLQRYRTIVNEIVNMIEADGCKVYTDYSRTASSYLSTTEQPIIRISLLGVDKPLRVIWRLLHEYGHHLSGPRKAEDTDISREELAWKYAEATLRKYPALLEMKMEFKECKDHDLGTYYAKYAK
ncbi:hypothetical protein SAMN04488128_1011162 [Chitinophaga eiseniae]|uniref:Uncharacterized protein n=1 Tax=Chitinophaga eiseniae TaxID=634771 RepID=A0A1T4MLD6_9BACT|nr:hypothetical protein [Chitinophaga eiseniae]SJZ67849.1 hypothetical protein SAMN04488128_1011162 [Chitinophaga eiseniae]